MAKTLKPYTAKQLLELKRRAAECHHILTVATQHDADGQRAQLHGALGNELSSVLGLLLDLGATADFCYRNAAGK